MSARNRQLTEQFFRDLSLGEFPASTFTEDATFWTLTGGAGTKEKFQGGVKLLQSLFPNRLTYSIDSLVADDVGAAAEVQSRGVLSTGQDFHNVHVFTFRFEGDRIASVKEYQNPDPVRATLIPLMQAAAQKMRDANA